MGRAEVLSEGSDVTLLTYGLMLREAEVARRRLEDDGIGVRLVNLRTLRPVDRGAILRAAAESRLLVTIEDHLLVGGLHSIVCETLVEAGARARVVPIALDGRWFKPALLDDVLAYERFDGASIAERVRAELRS
jgi:transketolase